MPPIVLVVYSNCKHIADLNPHKPSRAWFLSLDTRPFAQFRPDCNLKEDFLLAFISLTN